MLRIGMDLGGTKVEGIVIDEQDNEVLRKRVPTEQEQGYDHIISNIGGLYREYMATCRSRRAART